MVAQGALLSRGYQITKARIIETGRRVPLRYRTMSQGRRLSGTEMTETKGVARLSEGSAWNLRGKNGYAGPKGIDLRTRRC
jgi:hypothetical protein